MKKRILSLLLALVLLAALLPQTALTTRAASSGTWGDLSWSFDSSTGTLSIKGKGYMDSGAYPWHQFAESVKKVTIASGVKDIGMAAFAEYPALKSVSLPGTVTAIGGMAFIGCAKLSAVTLPASLTQIADSAFSGCTGLKSITIPSTVTRIGADAFSGCTGLSEIAIPAGVTEIGAGAFSGCTGLTMITVASGNSAYKADSKGILFNYAKTELLQCPGAFSGSCSIPDTVVTVQSNAFSHCAGLTAVTIPDSVRTIGARSFFACSGLSKVNIPAGVEEIGASAFSGCTTLTRITVASGNANYKSDANGILFNKKLTTLLRCPAGFSGSYTIPSTVTYLNTQAFSDCASLTKITIPDSVKTIENETFRGCSSLRCVNLPDTLQAVWGGAFQDCPSLKGVEIPSGVMFIAANAFGYETDAAGNPRKLSEFAIFGKTGTQAEQYAKDNGFPFNPTIAAPTVTVSNVASSGKIKLEWKKVSLATAYKVYRAESKDGPFKLMKTVTDGTSYVNSSAEAGKTYFYQVRAVNTDLGKNGKYSAVKSRTCDLPRPVVTASNVADSGKIKLTWKAVDGAVSYKVYRAESKDGPYKLMKTVTDGVSYTNTSVEAGQKYWYKVKAVAANTDANSADSAVKSRTCDLPRPVVSITRTSAGKPKLTWKKVTGAVSYKVYRCDTKTGTYKLMKTVTDGTSYVNSTAEAGKTWYYKVKAVHKNAEALSAFSLVKSITAR